jgi:hypothetical protein
MHYIVYNEDAAERSSVDSSRAPYLIERRCSGQLGMHPLLKNPPI